MVDSLLNREPWEDLERYEAERDEEATGKCSECGCNIYSETAFAPEGEPLCEACAKEWIDDKTIWME